MIFLALPAFTTYKYLGLTELLLKCYKMDNGMLKILLETQESAYKNALQIFMKKKKKMMRSLSPLEKL